MEATQVLKTEHQAIRIMLAVLENVADRLDRGEKVDVADLESMLEFIRVFADRCHHTKEEDLLFPALEKVGFPREGGPVGVMLAEHDIGREYVRGLAAAAQRLAEGDQLACAAAARNARAYAQLLDAHIDKEDNILYLMADMHLDEEEQGRLAREFERVEEEHIGHGRHEQFHELLHTLRDRYLR